MLTVRRANIDADFLAIEEAAGKFADAMNRPDVFPAAGSYELGVALAAFLLTEGVTVLLAEDEGKLVGGFAYYISPYVWDRKKLSAEEIFWWCDANAPPRAAMMLLKEAQKDWREAGVSVYTLHRLSQSPAGVDKVYQKMGAQPMQTTYVGTM